MSVEAQVQQLVTPQPQHQCVNSHANRKRPQVGQGHIRAAEQADAKATEQVDSKGDHTEPIEGAAAEVVNVEPVEGFADNTTVHVDNSRSMMWWLTHGCTHPWEILPEPPVAAAVKHIHPIRFCGYNDDFFQVRPSCRLLWGCWFH